MLHKMLDRLLAMHFKIPATNNKLDRLEQDVWSKIHAASADMVQPWYDKMAMAFAVPQFRVASLAIALIIGITVSPVLSPSKASASNQDILGLSVFAAQSSYLPSTLIERVK